MQSVNNIFPDLEDKIYSRYRKAAVCMIGGVRGDPYKGGYHRLEYVLKSKFDNFNPETGEVTFSYSDDIIEIYSADEDKLFRQLNASAIKQGSLVPYAQAREEVDMSSALPDEEIAELAGAKNLLNFKKRVSEITSLITLRRLVTAVKNADRTYSFINVVETRIKELE